jgi:hypothetical protein
LKKILIEVHLSPRDYSRLSGRFYIKRGLNGAKLGSPLIYQVVARFNNGGKNKSTVENSLTLACLRDRLTIRFSMRILACSLFFGMVMAFPLMAQNAQFGAPAIISPRPGDVLQGVATITGTTDVAGFVSAEISFTYVDDPTGTWFLIARINQPVFKDRLTTWDTTVITDGDYMIRLQVFLSDGSTLEALVPGVRVRNYTPVETPTPMAITQAATPFATITRTATPFPTPTPLPANPAILAPTEITASLLYGGLAAILTFVIIGIFFWLRRKFL